METEVQHVWSMTGLKRKDRTEIQDNQTTERLQAPLQPSPAPLLNPLLVGNQAKADPIQALALVSLQGPDVGSSCADIQPAHLTLMYI